MSRGRERSDTGRRIGRGAIPPPLAGLDQGHLPCDARHLARENALAISGLLGLRRRRGWRQKLLLPPCRRRRGSCRRIGQGAIPPPLARLGKGGLQIDERRFVRKIVLAISASSDEDRTWAPWVGEPAGRSVDLAAVTAAHEGTPRLTPRAKRLVTAGQTLGRRVRSRAPPGPRADYPRRLLH